MYSTQNTLNVTKAAIAQMTSSGYMGELPELTELNDQFIVDLGEKLNISDGDITVNSAADIFFKSLLSQLGKIVIDTRSYVAQLPKLFVDPINWGLFSEFVTFELSDVMIDEMWNPDGYIPWNAPDNAGVAEGGRIAAIEFGCYKPPVLAKLYKKVHGIMTALTTAREQMFTAFRNVDEYNSFIAGLFNCVDNTIQLKAEVYALMCVSMGIAKAKAHGNEINLLAEYHILTGDYSITKSNALQSAEFLKFALMRIAETKDNIRRFTELYNNHEHITFAAEPNVILLNKFANATKFNVRANTYNEELLGIGDYDKVSAWQANISNAGNEKFAFDAVSGISLTKAAAVEAGLLESTSTRTKYDITGVIGVIYDRYAMAITIDKKKTTSQYSASRDTVNYFYHALANYIVNDNYPIVAFVIRDEEQIYAAPTLSIPTATTDFWGTKVSDMLNRSESSVNSHDINLKVKRVTTGSLAAEWGAGYFMPFEISNTDTNVTETYVEIVPTQGAGITKLDSDMNGVVKLNTDAQQTFVVTQVGAKGSQRTVYTINITYA